MSRSCSDGQICRGTKGFHHPWVLVNDATREKVEGFWKENNTVDDQMVFVDGFLR